MRIKRQFFNLIEIVLAIGAVAIGIVSIMALFPIGANASRDAMAEGYAAMSAEQFLHQLQRLIRNDWVNYISDSATTGHIRVDPTDVDNTGFTMVVPNSRDTIWYKDAGGKRYYLLRQYVDRSSPPNEQYDLGTDLIDFEAIMKVTKQPVQISGTPIPYTTATGLIAEISWPAQMPYSQRKKAVYYLELFKRS